MLRTKLILLLFLATNAVFAQPPRPTREELREMLKGIGFNEKFELGNDFMYDKIYAEAMFVWEVCLEEDPTNANLLYKMGMCLVYLNREVEALPYFEKAQYSVSKTYNPYSSLERNSPPEIMYYLAKSNHSKGNVDTAYYQYDFFLSTIKKKHERYEPAHLGISQCGVARKLMADPQNYIITNMGDVIYTASPEYAPVITIDGSALFFTSKKVRPDSTNKGVINMTNGQHYEDIYVSYRSFDGKWESPQYLKFCKPKKNEASVSVSPDGQTVFVYQDVGEGDIYISQLEDTVFKNMTPFPAEELNDSTTWETHATISPDGNYLYFVSDREGGMGGRDIYRLKKLPNGEWSKAMNLGPPVNSQYDEESPFLGADNATMYFSSNGASSMGGFDIFVTQMDADEKWSEPANMGYPLNSFDDDIFYTTTADGLTGYYSSDKMEGKGDKDIYMVETENSLIKNVAILTGFIFTSDGSMIPKGISIIVTDLTDNTPPTLYSPRRRDGGYVFALKPCHTYHLDYRLDSTTFYETELYVPCNSSYQELKHELLLNVVNLEAVSLQDVPLDGARWEFKNLNYIDALAGKQIEIYEDMELVYSEYINKYGQFPYKDLDPSKSHLLKINEDEFDFCEDLILNMLDSSSVIVDTYTFKANCETNSTVSDYSTILTTPIFQYNFGYNKDKFDVNNEALKLYVKGIRQLIDNGQTVTIVISSSASKVPTRAYASNIELSTTRRASGKAILIKLLEAEGIDTSKIKFVDGEAAVGGPEYNNDASSKANVYQRYQFIRYEIQF